MRALPSVDTGFCIHPASFPTGFVVGIGPGFGVGFVSSDAYSSSKGYLRDIRSYPTLQLGVELALRYLLTSPRQRFLWNVCRSWSGVCTSRFLYLRALLNPPLYHGDEYEFPLPPLETSTICCRFGIPTHLLLVPPKVLNSD